MVEKTNIFDKNLQKQLLLYYDQNSKTKTQEWVKIIADKNSLMTIVFAQCNEATRTDIALGTTYKTDHWDESIISFLVSLRTVCYWRVNEGLSFKPWKNFVAIKSLKNFIKVKQNDPHGFKEELKIKYDAVLDVAGKFPNRIGSMIELLKAETQTLDHKNYYGMNIIDQAIWEQSDDASTKAMFLLLNSKDNNTKKDLFLSYLLGNKSTYPTTAQIMVRYLLT